MGRLYVQILQMLQGSTVPGSAFAFDHATSTFGVVEGVHVGHYSPEALAGLLRDFAAAGSQAVR